MTLSFLSLWTNLLYDGLLRSQILFILLLISDKLSKKRWKEKQKKVKKGKDGIKCDKLYYLFVLSKYCKLNKNEKPLNIKNPYMKQLRFTHTQP